MSAVDGGMATMPTPVDGSIRAAYEAIRATDLTDSGDPAGMSYDHCARHYPTTLPESALVFSTVREIRQAVESSGSHFWDPQAVRWFRGKTDSRLYGGRFWVESRRYVPGPYSDDPNTYPREYMVAWVAPAHTPGGFLPVERLGTLPTLAAARTACTILAGAVERHLKGSLTGSQDVTR